MEKLIVTSPCFEQSGLIPVEYTGHGADNSPELVLTGLTLEAVSIAVILNDMDHPVPAYNHWVLWNLPPMGTIPGSIPHGERLAALGGAVQGIGYGKHCHKGPKPPFHWSHVYFYNVYALDCMLDLPVATKKRGLLAAMEGHVLQHGVLKGHYR